MAMVFVVLNRMCRKHQAEAWILMFFATIYAVVVHPERLPADFPTHAFSGVAGCLVHPLYASGAYLFRMFFLSRLLSRDVWLVGIGLAGPVLHGAPQFSRAVWKMHDGKDIALLLGAFVLLGAGALIQWLQHRSACDGTKSPECEQ